MKLNVKVLPLIAVAAAFGTAGALAQRDHPKRAKPEGDAQSAMQSSGTNRRKELLRERQQAADTGCWRCIKNARPGCRMSTQLGGSLKYYARVRISVSIILGGLNRSAAWTL